MNFKQIKELLSYYLHFRQKPLVIQMPITSRCNSRCKTCNIWKLSDHVDIDHEALKKALRDPFFSQVKTVGLNGGEFTLVPNFIDIINSVLILPQIKDIYCISNGLAPKRLFEYLEKAKEICKQKSVKIHICISVDGYGKVQEEVRGIPNCFKKTKEILDFLSTNKDKYCDDFSVGCTISIHNIDFIKETEMFLNTYNNLQVEYHCAIPNKRILTFDNADYYVLNDERKRIQAAEFFFEKCITSKSLHMRIQYFSSFYFLIHNGYNRLNICSYTNRDVTIDEKLNLLLCATASEVIGNLKEKSATELTKTKCYKKTQKEILNLCDNCVHYTYHPLTIRGRVEYIKFYMRNRYVWQYYNIQRKEKSFFSVHINFYKQFTIELLRQIYHLLWKLQ